MNLTFLVSFVNIWEMVKDWSSRANCDVDMDTRVSLSISNSTLEVDFPYAFFTLNWLISYVLFGSNFENIGSEKQTARIVDDVSFPQRFIENMEPSFLVRRTGLLLRTAQVNLCDDFRGDCGTGADLMVSIVKSNSCKGENILDKLVLKLYSWVSYDVTHFSEVNCKSRHSSLSEFVHCMCWEQICAISHHLLTLDRIISYHLLTLVQDKQEYS